MIDFCRKIDRPLVVRWADVAVVTQFMGIDVFEKCATKCFDMKYRVEVDGCARELRITCLYVQFRRIAQLRHKAAVDGVDLLIIDHLLIEVQVAVKTVRAAVVARQNKACIVAQWR